MKTFSIKDIESITGIKAHTIRIWEQRYSLITPKRTETNIRYYDGEDVKKFINITTLANEGLKISEIAKMSEDEIQSKLKSISGCKNGICACSKSIICDAMFKFNADAFDKAVDSCVDKNGLETTMLDIIIPFINKVMGMWQAGTIMEVNVEFIKHLIAQRITVAISQLPNLKTCYDKCLLLMLEGEKNEIGLLFTEYLLRKRGIQTLYLGASSRQANLKQVMQFCTPNYVFVASMMELNPCDRNAALNSLTDIIPSEDIIFVSPTSQPLDSDIQKKVKVFVDFNQMIDFIDKTIMKPI